MTEASGCGLLGLYRLIEIPLEADEDVADLANASEFPHCIGHGVVLQLQEAGEFLLVKLGDSLGDVMGQDKVEELLLFVRIVLEHAGLAGSYSFFPCDRGVIECDIGEDIEEIALVGINQAADLFQLVTTESFFLKASQEFLTGIGSAPE